MAKNKSKKASSARKGNNFPSGQTKDAKKMETRDEGSSQSSIVIPSVFIAIVALLIGGGMHFHSGATIEGVPTTIDNETLQTNRSILLEDSPETPSEETPLLSQGTKVDISLYHDVGASDEADINTNLLNYIRFDAGYAVCLDPKNFENDNFGVLALKKFKFQFLQKIASDPESWVAKLPVDAHNLSSDEVMTEAKKIQSTCRLITLTHEDYDGAADRVIRDAVKTSEIFYIPRLNAASEYRTMVCLLQLTDSYLSYASATDIPAYENLRNAWALEGQKERENALNEPARPMPIGWEEGRDKKSGHTYYLNQKTGKTTWIRPVPRWGAKSFRKDPPPPAEGKKNQLASLVSRKKPCDFDLTAELFREMV